MSNMLHIGIRVTNFSTNFPFLLAALKPGLLYYGRLQSASLVH